MSKTGLDFVSIVLPRDVMVGGTYLIAQGIVGTYCGDGQWSLSPDRGSHAPVMFYQERNSSQPKDKRKQK